MRIQGGGGGNSAKCSPLKENMPFEGRRKGLVSTACAHILACTYMYMHTDCIYHERCTVRQSSEGRSHHT